MKRTVVQIVIDHAEMNETQQAELVNIAEQRIYCLDRVKDVSAVLQGAAPPGLHPVMQNGMAIPGIYSLVSA